MDILWSTSNFVAVFDAFLGHFDTCGKLLVTFRTFHPPICFKIIFHPFAIHPHREKKWLSKSRFSHSVGSYLYCELSTSGCAHVILSFHVSSLQCSNANYILTSVHCNAPMNITHHTPHTPHTPNTPHTPHTIHRFGSRGNG
jgi:hypothetical protein